MQTPFRLDGYSILITGAGSGIGAATAHEMAAAGASQLILVGRDAAKLQRTATSVAEQSEASIACVAADIADAAGREKVVTAVRHYGRLDALVNNAGLFEAQPLRETSGESWERNFAINTTAPFMLIRDLIDTLVASGRGSIVNISSTLAVKAIPGASAYNASKAALGQMTRTLALELGPEGVRVNAILPAIVDTPMYRGRYSDQASYEASVPAVDKLHPLGRMGQPSDIAQAAVFLVSPAASWITGVELPVDGGMLVT